MLMAAKTNKANYLKPKSWNTNLLQLTFIGQTQQQRVNRRDRTVHLRLLCMMLYISTSVSIQTVGNTDTGHTSKEQDWIQPCNILAELDRYIFFSAGSILHTHKSGDDCNHICLPPTIEYPPAMYFILAVPRSSSSCVNASCGLREAQTLNLVDANVVSDQSKIK